jgi:hypothetical protein
MVVVKLVCVVVGWWVLCVAAVDLSGVVDQLNLLEAVETHLEHDLELEEMRAAVASESPTVKGGGAGGATALALDLDHDFTFTPFPSNGFTTTLKPDQAMLNSSVRSIGNLPRWAAFFKQMSSGKPLLIVAYGGSVTEGHGTCGHDQAICGDFPKGDANPFVWPSRFVKWLSAKTSVNHTMKNLAISAEDSCGAQSGMHSDETWKRADMVLVETNLNDFRCDNHRLCMEALIRAVLANKPDAVIVLVDMVMPHGHAAGMRATLTHREMARHYDLPQVSMEDAFYKTTDWSAPRTKVPECVHSEEMPASVTGAAVLEFCTGKLSDHTGVSCSGWQAFSSSDSANANDGASAHSLCWSSVSMLSDDPWHPNAFGHALECDFLVLLLQRAMASAMGNTQQLPALGSIPTLEPAAKVQARQSIKLRSTFLECNGMMDAMQDMHQNLTFPGAYGLTGAECMLVLLNAPNWQHPNLGSTAGPCYAKIDELWHEKPVTTAGFTGMLQAKKTLKTCEWTNSGWWNERLALPHLATTCSKVMW